MRGKCLILVKGGRLHVRSTLLGVFAVEDGNPLTDVLELLLLLRVEQFDDGVRVEHVLRILKDYYYFN